MRTIMRISAYNIAIYPQRSPAIVIETNSLCMIGTPLSFSDVVHLIAEGRRQPFLYLRRKTTSGIEKEILKRPAGHEV